MTNKTHPTAHAVNAATNSADLRRIPGLSEQDAGLLEQAASMLEGLHNDERNRGNCSTAEGAACSADAVRRLTVQLLRAAQSAPCLHQIAEPEGLAEVSKEQYARMFGAACDALGQISDHLGIDSDINPGAEPIIEAIDELRAAAPHAVPPAPGWDEFRGDLEKRGQIVIRLENVNQGEQWHASSNHSARIVVSQSTAQEALRLALIDAGQAAPAAPPAPAGVAVPPLTPDEARWAAQSADRMRGPSDTTQPAAYAMAGALALAAKLAAAPAQPFTPAFADGLLHSTVLHKLWEESEPTAQRGHPGALAWQLGVFAGKVAQAAAAPAQAVAVPQTWMLVPLEFVQGFCTLAHNYSLTAESPDHYHGVERDAFRSAYERCGRDLAKLRAMLSTPTPAQEHATQLAGQGRWRHIDTAPKDSKARLVWCPERQNIYAVTWLKKRGWQIFGGGLLSEVPSLWMPMPADPIAAAPAQAQEDARAVEPDMFWNMDEPESQHGSIEKFLSDEVSNGFLEVGTVFTMLCASKTPNITIRVTKVDHDECEAEYEVIDATRAAQGGA